MKAWFRRRRQSSATREAQPAPQPAQQPPQLPQLTTTTEPASTGVEATPETAETAEAPEIAAEGEEGEGSATGSKEDDERNAPLGSHPIRTSEIERLKKGDSTSSTQSDVGVLDAFKTTFLPHHHAEPTRRLKKAVPEEQQEQEEEEEQEQEQEAANESAAETGSQAGEKHTIRPVGGSASSASSPRGSRFSEKL